MENKPFSIPKMPRKAEVLRKAAERYPELEPDAMEVLSHIQRVTEQAQCPSSEALERYHLSEGKFFVLAYLFSEDLLGSPAPSPSEIAEHLGVTRATITGLLDGLERDDFLERQHDSKDRRALTIHMTSKTRRFLDEFIPDQSRRINALMVHLCADERKQLIALLSKIET